MTLTLVLVSTALNGADNPFFGTWKLNTAKSKSSPTPVAQSMTVKFEADGGKVRRTVSGVDGEGKPSGVSKDGKTMTNTVNGVTEKDVKFHTVEVLEKQ
ncbi:MAG TPA: hypothetical protein VM120_18395 [Bryobacteraceae bacterium]|nr:hypothetical protein [Bryobacteraceae bacterium]